MSQNEQIHFCKKKLSFIPLFLIMITGCGLDPFSQLISNKLKDSAGQYNDSGSICPQALVVSNSGFSLSSIETRKVFSSKQRFLAGTKLVATYAENCRSANEKIDYEDFVIRSDMDIEDLEEQAQEDPCLIQITENFKYKLNMVSDDLQIGQQKHLDAIRAEQAYDVFYNTTTGIQQQIVIAIIDSGVDLDHEDLKDNIWKNTAEIPNNGIDEDKNGYVDDVEGWNFGPGQSANNPRPVEWTDGSGGEKHGTHVAGLAAATWNNTLGGSGIMGRNVKIMALNIFGDASDADDETIGTVRLNKAIRYAADKKADIINLSLGACGYDKATYDSILYAICKGSTVITAAGNTYYDDNGTIVGRELSDNRADASNSCGSDVNTKFYQTPASFGAAINGLIVVGSTDAIPNAQTQYSKSNFSSWSTRLVEIGAPGSQGSTAGLFSTVPGGSYSRMKGTSMSTPVVAGAAALAKSYAARKGVALTPMNLEKLIQASGRNETLLNRYFKNGKHLDLLNLANEINSNINSYR